jgi:hypothetical protein
LAISKGLAKQRQIQAVVLAIWPLLSSVKESFAYASFLAGEAHSTVGLLASSARRQAARNGPSVFNAQPITVGPSGTHTVGKPNLTG